MGETTITCASVDERDLDTRYLAGALGEAEAEAFEAHYFGCDRCWGLVRDGNAIRAALSPAGAGARRRARWPHALRWGIAAGLAVVAAGIALWPRPPGSQPADTTVRGGEVRAIAVAARRSSDSLTLSWSHVDRAERYRVRLFSGQGDLVLERASVDTALTLPSAALPGGGGAAEVTAEDRLHLPLGRSGLVPLPPTQP
jgi:hypothetical protein